MTTRRTRVKAAKPRRALDGSKFSVKLGGKTILCSRINYKPARPCHYDKRNVDRGPLVHMKRVYLIEACRVCLAWRVAPQYNDEVRGPFSKWRLTPRPFVKTKPRAKKR